LGTASADFIAAHHASIAWYLNRRLAETSDTQREMQEERMRRQVHRTKTLGAGATHEALAFETPSGGSLAVPASMQREASTGSSIDSWLGGVPGSLASNIAASIRDPFVGSSSSSIPVAVEDDADSSEDELELSQSQIMQFEAENAHMLREMQDTLQSVQQAEARLLEISSLQTELVTQLQRQTELTDQLYEDAIAATGSVEKGNVQLREARRRAKDSRLFVLIFLIGASLSLLFLHYY
jgi:syntaxin 18